MYREAGRVIAGIKGAPAATPRQSLTVTHSDSISNSSHLIKHAEQRQGQEDPEGQEAWNPRQAPEAQEEAAPWQGSL